MSYEVVRIQGRVAVVLRADGAQIPPDAANNDWQEFVAWNAEQDEPFSLEDTGPSLEELRVAKLAELEAWWAAHLQNGVVPPGFDFALGIDAGDVALLTGALALAREAVELELADSHAIVGKDGVLRQFALADLKVLLLSYGQARSALSVEYAAKKAAIEAAGSLEDLDAIEV